MRIKTDNKRNISVDFDLPDKFKLLNNSIETPYLQTGKRSFRLLGFGNIPEYLDVQEIYENKRKIKPMKINPSPIAFINANDVLTLNKVAQDLELEQNILNEKQNDLENKQIYLDIQNKNLLQNIENVKQLETDNLQKIEENKNSLVSLAYEIGKTNELVNSDFTTSVNLIEEHKQAVNPHNITKSTIGLNKVDNTSDIDKPISKAVKIALEDKANKQDVEDIKTEIEVYKKKADRIDRGLANFTGGIGGNELPIGGLEGQVLAKKTDETGEYQWVDMSGGTTDHNKLKNRDLENQHPINAITGLQENLTLLANENINIKVQIDANADAILKTRNDLQVEIDDNVGDISSLQADTTTIKSDLDDLGDQVAGIEEKIPETASSVNQLVDKAYVDNAILALPKFEIKVVDVLPQIGEEKVIYLVAKNNESPDVYDEYIWVNNIFELIGSTQVDLSNYATKEYVDTTEQEIIENYMGADTALQTQITGLSTILDEEQEKITAIEGKIPTSASTSNLLSTANDLLNATQDVRSDFAEADSELQTQINRQAIAIAGKQEIISDLETIRTNSNLGATALQNKTSSNHGLALSYGNDTATASLGGTSIGSNSQAGSYAVALGDLAKATGKRSVQLGKGTNTTAGTLMFGNDSGNYTVLDASGKIPNERIPSKQDLLVSGTNIKTINGESIIGGGDLEIKSGGSGRNIGDIFYTTRTDTELNGAVECNGGTYNIGDFDGAQSVGNLLTSGSLPYVSLSEYENLIIANGSCRAFGWDGGEQFRVPLLNDVYIEAGTATSAGEFINESLPNITGSFAGEGYAGHSPDGAFYVGSSISGAASGGTDHIINFDASLSSSVYQNGAKVKPDSVRYRAMVQLANEATDEAVITATSALQQISEIVPTITYWE